MSILYYLFKKIYRHELTASKEDTFVSFKLANVLLGHPGLKDDEKCHGTNALKATNTDPH